MNNTAINGKQITVNGMTCTLHVVEAFKTAMNGQSYARPYYQVVVEHGQYKTTVMNYTSKAALAKFAVKDATKKINQIYPATKLAVVDITHASAAQIDALLAPYTKPDVDEDPLAFLD